MSVTFKMDHIWFVYLFIYFYYQLAIAEVLGPTTHIHLSPDVL